MGDTPDVELSYVNHRYEKSQREDGRRVHKWFLTDQFGTEHLAVIGIETDTMDGHYSYQALEPFASRMPLNCGNQGGVVKWLRDWLAGNIPADDGEFPTYSGGAASSAGTGAGTGSGRRKAFASSLCSSRAAILNAAGASPISHYVAGGGGSGKGKGKKAGAGNQTAMASYSSGVGGKQKPVGIVQQNQIKKARKIQDDIRAEHERLVVGHLSRLRRAAAAELQADSAAKQVTMAWLQGAPSSEELEALDHWRGLLAAVLDLQDQQRQQDAAAGAADGGGSSQQEGQQQRAVKQKGGSSNRVAAAEANGSDQLEQQGQQQQRMGKQKGGGGGGGAAAGAVQEKLLLWLQQPDSRRHYLRVVLECLRELAAVEIPARVLMQHQLVALVQRCKCEHQHEAVKSLAESMLSRWRWQLAGHMQVLCEPTYMQDHAGVLEEEHAAGQVPLPTLPQYKQAVLDTPLPVLPGTRNAYTPAHSYQQHHVVYVHQHQQHPTQTASAPQLYDASAAAAGYAALQGFPEFTSAEGVTAGFDGAAAGFGGYNPANAAAAYYSPMAGLQSVQLGGSSPLPQLPGQQQQQQLMMYGQSSMGLCLPGQQQQLLAADGGLAAAGGAGVGAMLAPGDASAGFSAMPAGWQQAAAAGAAAAAADAASSGLYMYGMHANGSPAAFEGMLGEQQAGAMSMQQQQQLL